jgi:RNA binding exosome subunit
MQSPAITTIIKMIETLSESAQNQIADHLREYIAEMQDEARWDDLFARTQDKLAAAARHAKQEIAAGKASPMDYDAL